mmetsp:Transcript_5349/g.16857  ORF Transcript_5349/g.16857 Transcript_5349/m.16857 type:complete len:97 (+) Transcript_5349:254-544(+)
MATRTFVTILVSCRLFLPPTLFRLTYLAATVRSFSTFPSHACLLHLERHAQKERHSESATAERSSKEEVRGRRAFGWRVRFFCRGRRVFRRGQGRI